MNKIILSIIVIFLLPISVFGFDWTVSYDMKKSDGMSWFTRNTKNWHIVYNWLPYSKPIERDSLCSRCGFSDV